MKVKSNLKCIKKTLFHGIDIYILPNNIVIQIYKRCNKSRLNTQSDHLITLLTISQLTINDIFLDNGNVLCPPSGTHPVAPTDSVHRVDNLYFDDYDVSQEW